MYFFVPFEDWRRYNRYMPYFHYWATFAVFYIFPFFYIAFNIYAAFWTNISETWIRPYIALFSAVAMPLIFWYDATIS